MLTSVARRIVDKVDAGIMRHLRHLYFPLETEKV